MIASCVFDFFDDVGFYSACSAVSVVLLDNLGCLQKVWNAACIEQQEGGIVASTCDSKIAQVSHECI